MTLDMTIYGEKTISSVFDDDPVLEDGYVVVGKTVQLASLRHNEGLHDFIVNTFANGKDDCQRINLTCENLACIIGALITDQVFYTGPDHELKKKADIETFHKIVRWLNDTAIFSPKPGKKKTPEWRYVYYQSAW